MKKILLTIAALLAATNVQADTLPKVQLDENSLTALIRYMSTRSIELVALKCEERFMLDASLNTSKFWHVRSQDALAKLTTLETPQVVATLMTRGEKYVTERIRIGIADDVLAVTHCKTLAPEHAQSALAELEQSMREELK